MEVHAALGRPEVLIVGLVEACNLLLAVNGAVRAVLLVEPVLAAEPPRVQAGWVDWGGVVGRG